MRPTTREGILKAALDKWGKNSQLALLAEECCELATSILHHLRGRSDCNVSEEIADVQIMIDQIKSIEGMKFIIENYEEMKLKRLCDRLGIDFPGHFMEGGE